ncbi:hypothetical protein pipiens_005788 [Culex pipiens pipiens]|uniref:Uncharacterized protein n=1 Tax=Culex pipiens pipiens TaxID=38569 RepID=A0ABD1DW51_CULPP
MWEMLDLDLDCGQDECGGPGPPPEFLIPPPPRPPFLAELANCNEDGAGGAVAAMLGGPGAGPFGAIADGAAMCEAIPCAKVPWNCYDYCRSLNDHHARVGKSWPS